jgi:UDP-N-acetylglucosamine 2-epimerase
MAAALDHLRPRVALTYAEAGGWGRALVIEARRRGIVVCGLQHGFIHRHWMNYLHEPDEMAQDSGSPGFPRPDLTLLFDRLALEHLVARGSFPASSLGIMGNPRLDELAEAARRQTDATRSATRRRLGVDPAARIVLLATKYRERAHAALEALFDAVRSMPGVHLVVRCHPAETPGPYLVLANGASTISVAPADIDLVSSLAVSDLVVTVNSTVALEAMALGVPALALNMPNYLSPFVETGVMYGAASPGQVASLLRHALSDGPSREDFRARQQAFMAKYDMLPSGSAAEKAVRAILTLAHAKDG